MVTVPQFQQQLQQRQQTISSASRQVQAFDPRVRQSQAQLRKATPLSQTKIRSTEQKREGIKQEAMSTIAKEQTSQSQLESKFAPIKAKFMKQQQRQRDIKKAIDILSGDDTLIGASGAVKRLVRNAGSIPQTTSTEEALQMSLPAELRNLTPTEVLTDQSLPTSLRGISSEELNLGVSLPEVNMSLASIQDLQGKLPSKIATLPTLGSRFRGDVRKVTGISLPGIRDKFSIPTSRAEARRRLGAGVDRVTGNVVAFSEIVSEQAGKTAELGSERVGFKEGTVVDVGTTPIGRKETIIFEPPKMGESITNLKPLNVFSERQTVSLSPTSIGGSVRTVAGLGQFAIPVYGSALAGAFGIQGARIASVKIPTASGLIKQETADLTIQQRADYLKTEEGKVYQKSVDDYIGGLKKQRTSGYLQAGLGATGLIAPFAVRGVRYAKQPIIKQIITPQRVKIPAQAGVFVQGERAIGVGVGGVKTTEELISLQPRYSTWLKRKPTIYGYTPEKLTSFSPQAFAIEGADAFSIGFQQAGGKRATLKRFFQTTEYQKPVAVKPGDVLDRSKLPGSFRYVAKDIPTRAGQGMQSFIGVGREFKGQGLLTKPTVVGGNLIVPKRALRASKGQSQFFYPTRAPTLKEAPLSLQFSNVQKVGKLSDFEVYVTETGSGTVKTLKPRKLPKVEYDVGFTYLKEIPRTTSAGTKIGGSGAKTKQLSKLEKQQLVARVRTLIKPPKVKPIVPAADKLNAQLKSSTFTPTIVPKGASARTVSEFYGKGTYERTDSVVSPIPTSTQTFLPTDNLMTRSLVLDGQKDNSVVRIKGSAIGGSREGVVLGDGLSVRDALIPKVTVIPVSPQTSAPRLRDALIPKLKITSPTQPATKPRRPVGPRPRSPIRRLRPPKRPSKPVPFIKPPLKKLPKKVGKKKGLSDLVTPFVKRRGKFIAVGGPTTQARALKKGVSKLRGSLAASLQLRRTSGKVIPIARETKEFRIGKAGAGTLVQRRGKRLGRIGETREIVASRRRGVRFI